MVPPVLGRPAALAALAALGCGLGIGAAPRLAAADPDPSNATKSDTLGNVQPDSGKIVVNVPAEIVIKSTPDRSTANIALIASVAGVGAIVGGLGLWAHLESRVAASDVSAADFTNKAWTTQLQAEQDRSNRDATRAEIGYSIGGALLIAATLALLATAPSEQTTVLAPKVGAAPTRGGATAVATWSF
jgi:hypothetical protein